MNKSSRIKVIIAAAVIGVSAAYLLSQIIESSWAYYCSVDEFVETVPIPTLRDGTTIDRNRIIRLAGTVKEGSIIHNVEKMQLDFDLAGQNKSVPVRFYGPVPKNFVAGKEVVVEGRISGDGIFQAGKILTRCESKYTVKLNPKSRDM